jgi:hypothetical protein
MFMNKPIFLLSVIVLSILLSLSCQNKMTEDKEYSTTISGKITYRGVNIPGASVNSGSFATTTDSQGLYSLSIIHKGSFIMTATYQGRLGAINYSENIATTDQSLTKDIAQ